MLAVPPPVTTSLLAVEGLSLFAVLFTWPTYMCRVTFRSPSAPTVRVLLDAAALSP